jgi:hypothetical protein
MGLKMFGMCSGVSDGPLAWWFLVVSPQIHRGQEYRVSQRIGAGRLFRVSVLASVRVFTSVPTLSGFVSQVLLLQGPIERFIIEPGHISCRFHILTRIPRSGHLYEIISSTPQLPLE